MTCAKVNFWFVSVEYVLKVLRIQAGANMNPKGKLVSLIYALVLFGCAFFAGFDTFGFAFGIGDGGGQVSLATGTFLISTLAGGVGLVIAALGSWTRWQGATVIALVSVIIVLPAAVLYACQNGHAFWMNTQLGMHFGLWAWPSAILPPFLDVVAAGLSWVRLRR
jgi:hypothetical protein